MAKRIIQDNQDQASIDATLYNKQSGAQKNMEVGRHLLPIPATASTWTTDTTTARSLPKKGASLAIYNNANAVGAVTLGKTAAEVATALAPGVADANGNVGVPCAPNDWTYISCFDKSWVKGTAATLLVFLVADDSEIR